MSTTDDTPLLPWVRVGRNRRHIAVVEGEFVCRRLITQEGLCLRASDPGVADVIPGDGEDLRVWGVVTTVVKSPPV